MDIRIRYTSAEVRELVLAHHKRLFGEAPDNEEWNVSGGYDVYTVENITQEGGNWQ